MKKLVIALAAAAALTSPALAADMAAKAPLRAAPVAYAPTWTGCYVSGGGGYGSLRTSRRSSVTIPAQSSPLNRSADQGGRGWIGTLQAGCDYQFPIGANQFVVGAFGDYNFSDINGDFTGHGGRVGLGKLVGREDRTGTGPAAAASAGSSIPRLPHLFLGWLH